MNDKTAGTQSMKELLIVEKNRGVGYLGLNRPEKHNAVSYEMWQGIAQVMDDFESDDSVRVIIIAGEGGKAFSAGADISEFEQMLSRYTTGRLDLRSRN